MSRKNTHYSPELKKKLLDEYQEGGVSLYKLAKKYSVGYSCARRWWNNYKLYGDEAIAGNHHNGCFSAETKKKAVEEYLQGGTTIKAVAEKYKILAPSTLGNWIRQYNNHEQLSNSRPEGLVKMVKKNQARKTTLQERIEIARYCINNDKNYSQTALKYNVTYQQVYNWVKKYLSAGEDGLKDRRGKNKPEEELSKTERLQMENRLLKEEIKKKQMEIDLIKKVREIEGR